MSLLLHTGASPIDYAGLRALTMPEATASHVPIAHHRVVDLIKGSLAMFGHEVTTENYGVTEDGMRFFGLLSLRSTYGGYEDTVALRNSHDKKFPIGVGFGGRVFCCDNLSFIADHVIKRKHTANAKRDLPGLVGELIEPLAIEREKQHQTFLTYQKTPIRDWQADHAIMSMYRQGIIGLQRIADVEEAWQKPPFEEWGDRTAWRLFNATTYALTGRVVENTDVTPRLHKIIDGMCIPEPHRPH